MKGPFWFFFYETVEIANNGYKHPPYISKIVKTTQKTVKK